MQHTGGEHNITFMYCQCEPLVATMVRARLWPATAQRPHLALYIWAAGLGRGTSVRVPGCIKGPAQSLVLQVSTSCYQGMWMHVYDCASLLKPFVTYCRGKTTTHQWLMHLKSIGMWSSVITRMHTNYTYKNTVGKIKFVLPPCLTQVYESGVAPSCFCLSWPWLW